MTDVHNLGQWAAFAARLADAARAETLARWRGAGVARNKAGKHGYDPVTEADVAAEQAMRAVIEGVYPDHGIAGEETEERASRSPYVWSLDPIDGTRSFVCGMPTWTTLIGLLADGEPILGVIDAPRLGERYIGFGTTAVLIDRDGEHALRTSDCTRLADARFSATDPFMFEGASWDAFETLRKGARTTRYGHDGYGYARLAAGAIDLVVESGLRPYDYNALVPIIRTAGGAVGNWRGGSDMAEGRIIAAATQQLFDEVVGLMNDGLP